MRRLLKYAVLKALSSRPLFTVVVLSCRAMKHDYDHMLNGAVRGFPGPGFWQKIRQRPSPALLALLSRRLRKYRFRRLARRTANGRLLSQRLRGRCRAPALRPKRTPTGCSRWWRRPDEMLAALRQAGFDATQGQSMCVVPTPDERGDMLAPTAADTLARIVFLPIYPEMPTRSVRKMAHAVLQVLRQRRKEKKTRVPNAAHRRATGNRRCAPHAPVVVGSATPIPAASADPVAPGRFPARRHPAGNCRLALSPRCPDSRRTPLTGRLLRYTNGSLTSNVGLTPCSPFDKGDPPMCVCRDHGSVAVSKTVLPWHGADDRGVLPQRGLF